MQEEFARTFAMPLNRVRVTSLFVGGAFGGKFDLGEEGLVVSGSLPSTRWSR